MLSNFLAIEFTSMPIFDGQGIISLLLRFAMHFVILGIIVRGIYYPITRRKDYLFTYLLISTMIFIMCFILENVKLQLGMALGLFAVFGIIRYRTGQIPIKEMTYLFVVIGLAVVNALANKKISVGELMLANGVIVGIIWLLERVWTIQHVSRKVVQYDRIDLITPGHRAELIEDLNSRLGIQVERVDVGKVDFLRDTAKLVVYYKAQDSRSNLADDMESYLTDGSE
jgi:hypothetical protein